MESPLSTLSKEIAAAVERMAGAVVAVEGRPRFGTSGVIWREGIVITADHALRRDDNIRLHTPGGETVAAELAGRDPGSDLAVLRAAGLTFSNTVIRTDTLRAGELIIAVSRTRDGGPCAALGVVSSIAGPWTTWRGGHLERFVRLDVGAYPWSSGGAVIDSSGALIGIATTGLSRTSVLGIAAADVNRITDELLRSGHVARGYLGVGLQPIAIPEHLTQKLGPPQETALIVLSVTPDGPAGAAGVVIGDVLVTLNGKALLETGDVQDALGPDTVGRSLPLRLLRGGEPVDLQVTVGERPRRGA